MLPWLLAEAILLHCRMMAKDHELSDLAWEDLDSEYIAGIKSIRQFLDRVPLARDSLHLWLLRGPICGGWSPHFHFGRCFDSKMRGGADQQQ